MTTVVVQGADNVVDLETKFLRNSRAPIRRSIINNTRKAKGGETSVERLIIVNVVRIKKKAFPQSYPAS